MNPSDLSSSDISSLKIDSTDHSSMNGSLLGNRRSEGLILDFIKSDRLALYLSIGLMVVQSFHTSHALMNMTTLHAPINYIFGILTALLMDSLILYFVANANHRISFVFFLWCGLMNVYAYHIEMNYFTYQSFFSMVPAIGVPFAVYSVSHQLNPARRIKTIA